MSQTHHSLKKDLTKTVLLWSTSFFVLLGIIFSLSFNTLQTYILDLMADQRLHYQVHEFAKHLDEKDSTSIREESDALTQDSVISAILMVDASGELTHISLSKHQKPKLELNEPLRIDTLHSLIDARSNLHLYTRKIPGHHATLALVLDGTPVTMTIFSTTAWAALMMIMLVLISVKALHYSLRHQLVEPIEQLREAIEDQHLGDDAIHKLEEDLPEEASNILEFFDQLKHSRDDLRSHIPDLMEALPSCFWWSEDAKTYRSISGKACDLLQISPGDLEGQEFWHWCNSSAQMSVNAKQLNRAIAEKVERLDFAYQVNHHDQAHWFGESITICYAKDGSPETIYGIINDISARKNRQQEEAERLELMHRLEATGTLVGGIAHEFNNALAGMNGNVFLIKQNTNDEGNLNRIRNIEELIDRSASIIERMLAFARKRSSRPSPVHLIPFLNSFHTTMLPALPDCTRLTLHFEKNIEATNPIIIADQKLLQELLMQLVENADFATRNVAVPSINISLDLFEADEEFLHKHPGLSSTATVHLQLHDNGCGIADDIKDRIFEPFFTTREVGQGTGLGLSMVYGYINQLGGAIDVQSNPGNGSTFHVYLPCNNDTQTNKHEDTLLSGSGETILVVDDDITFRESTCEVLARMGYKTISAENGTEAVNLYEQHKEDIRLILMDILMPGMTGVQASRRIRKITPDVRIIFLTAYDRTQPLEPEVYDDNAELINKPFRISVLSQAIRKALQHSAIGSPDKNDIGSAS
ncbi:two-component system, NtrC family, sensor kinase [Mariprofundus micogutta]|uniref:histidine kinase n=1 Tax=Mariprofundus micogutta TaxID=1921010 RepID=A0A1L8CK25_9PROT|nr:response regulator [Mariprofundus micogutta]GAV19219.1 two-component system, NtrC family, sensor kinase [Mariprofundus micogutta]